MKSQQDGVLRLNRLDMRFPSDSDLKFGLFHQF